MMSSRDPYPLLKYDNDDNFMGRLQSDMPPDYKVPVHIAQSHDPWNRLHKTATLSSARHEVFSYDPQTPKDDLDFVLKSQYDQHGEIFRNRNEVLAQPETLGMNHGRVLKNRVKEVPAPPLPLNHPLRISEQKAKESPHSTKIAIGGHHTQTTNRGFARKNCGGFFNPAAIMD